MWQNQISCENCGSYCSGCANLSSGIQCRVTLLDRHQTARCRITEINFRYPVIVLGAASTELSFLNYRFWISHRNINLFQTIDAQPFYRKGPHLLLWAGMPAARKKINHCVFCIVYTWFANVANGPLTQPGGWHAARRLETHVLNFKGKRRKNGGLKVQSCLKRKRWTNSKSLLVASVVQTGQFQNRSHQNLLFYTDSCNIYCTGVNACSFTTHSLFQTLICQVETLSDVTPDAAGTRGEEMSFFLLGFSFLTYSCFILFLPSFIPRIIPPVLP